MIVCRAGGELLILIQPERVSARARTTGNMRIGFGTLTGLMRLTEACGVRNSSVAGRRRSLEQRRLGSCLVRVTIKLFGQFHKSRLAVRPPSRHSTCRPKSV